MLTDPISLLLIALLALLVAGALAPLEALGWWAGWFEGFIEPPAAASVPEPEVSERDRAFVVFLSGIHTVQGETFAQREKRLLDRLRDQLPDAEILEVFPYSVTNRPLTGQRVFAWFWRWALAMKLSRRLLAGAAGMLINVRNVWQVAVSVDRRYGPIYNRGTARLIVDALAARGYRPGQRIVLIGYSGGGQIALGAGPHVRAWADGPVSVVALGGVMGADPNMIELDHIWDLHGARDRVQQVGHLAFPGRWAIFPYSSWNLAKRKGILRNVPMGPLDHTGAGGYLDRHAFLPDGRSFLDQTVDVLAAIGRGEDPLAATWAAERNESNVG